MGLAIGMALQGTLGNFAAGVMLLIFRPFKIGDLIKAAGQMGVVKEIELFTTQMDTPDNRRLIIPNSAIFGHVIESLTFHDTRRVDVAVGTTYDGKTEDVRAILEKVPGQVEGVLKDPAPQIFLAELGGSSVDWKIRLWCKTADYWDVHQQAIQAIKHNLDEANIGIPYPQMDVHFDAGVTSALGGKKAA
jgi:small conductance mechanosensitive channel